MTQNKSLMCSCHVCSSITFYEEKMESVDIINIFLKTDFQLQTSVYSKTLFPCFAFIMNHHSPGLEVSSWNLTKTRGDQGVSTCPEGRYPDENSDPFLLKPPRGEKGSKRKHKLKYGGERNSESVLQKTGSYFEIFPSFGYPHHFLIGLAAAILDCSGRQQGLDKPQNFATLWLMTVSHSDATLA